MWIWALATAAHADRAEIEQFCRDYLATEGAPPSMVCQCLLAGDESSLWLGGLELDLSYGKTCFNVAYVMENSPSAHDPLRRPLEDKGAQVAARNGYLMEETHLVSQNESEQITDWLNLVALDEGVWELRDSWNERIAILDFGSNVPLDVTRTHLDEGDDADLLIAVQGGQLWVVMGPLEPELVVEPPEELEPAPQE